ncbi:MAG: thioredoxin domain-containing protein [Bacteroidaceae bacterium]|nr:thioredoxin domain-containing protein [Bacteroidaceae bacterium]
MMAKNLFVKICEELHIPFTCSYTNRKFEEHPYKHTLYGLHCLLAEYGVESEGIRFNNKEVVLSDLKTPFIAQVSGDLVLVTSITADEISYHWYDTAIHISHEQFKGVWSGVILLLSHTDNAGEPHYKEHHRAEKIQALKIGGDICSVIIILSIAAILHASQYSLSTLILFILNLVGFYLSYLLLQRQLNKSNNVANRLCNLLKHTTCTNLLDTPAAQAVGGISWSEIGEAYFTVNLLVLLFSPDAVPILEVFSFAALGYTAWSLWYQRFRAHAWCTLCLMVQGIFILQAITSFVFISSPFAKIGILLSFFIVFLLYTIATLSIHLLLAVVSKAHQTEQCRRNFNNFKLRREVFDSILQKEKRFEVEANPSIRFGNPNAPYRLTVLTNPYCNPCATMHARLSSINLTMCCVQFVFSSFGKKYDHVCRLLIAIYQQLGEETAWQLYGKWYTGGMTKRYLFFKNLNLDDTADTVTKEYSQHIEWRKQTGFSATPTVLINGYHIPRTYSIEDFKKIVIT